MPPSSRRRPDALAKLLKNYDCDRRRDIWLWLKVDSTEYGRLDPSTCASSGMRGEIARAMDGHPFNLAAIWKTRDHSLIPDAYLKWIENDERQYLWLAKRLEERVSPTLSRRLVHLVGKDHLIAMIDCWDIDLEEKAFEVEQLQKDWFKHKARGDLALEWFADKKEGRQRCICAGQWVERHYPNLLSERPTINSYKELLIFFDQKDFGRHEQKAIIREIKMRWHRQQFDERNADKKQVNVMLSKDVIAKLDTLGKRHNHKRAQVIETLVRMETEKGEYLTYTEATGQAGSEK